MGLLIPGVVVFAIWCIHRERMAAIKAFDELARRLPMDTDLKAEAPAPEADS